MPTPRRTSRPSTPTPSNSSATSSKPRSTPALTTPHHHKTADELAAEEAANILQLSTPTASRLRGTSTDILDGGSARALRHRRLNEVRLEEEHRKEETSTADESNEEAGSNDDVSRDIDLASVAESSTSAAIQEAETDLSSAGLSTGQIFGQSAQLDGRNEDEDSDESESQSQSDSDEDGSSTASSDSDSASDEDSDSDEDEEDERMEKLLQAAKEAARAKEKGKVVAGPTQGGEGDETVLQFDEDQKEKKKEAPIPDLSIPNLPKPHLSFSKDGRASAATTLPQVTEAGPSKRRMQSQTEVPVPELDNRPYERELSRREKQSQPRKATTSELWSTVPTPRTDLLPQMKRDYQALALANSLDPKRFMKGGSRSDKIPESFAIGTMVETSRHIRDTTLVKEKKYRPGQVVAGLIRDDDTGSYAKRKYGDLQWSRMENGRGKGGKKPVKW
ncbi:hypothetical protein CI109_103184 [Kwoniella shandongensis]|uniref:Uncharacterized protein n=1 Tax=Kwoniella shandongensis TaxID=1734106 RepID=A0A5M6C942_9TREE|nr:uncharacterized protein CI109_000375 [Kwoniella shandongensis]KAA5531533.1 hypothetical protein CI109_000375 [Kwoniella shandongensis]